MPVPGTACLTSPGSRGATCLRTNCRGRSSRWWHFYQSSWNMSDNCEALPDNCRTPYTFLYKSQFLSNNCDFCQMSDISQTQLYNVRGKKISVTIQNVGIVQYTTFVSVIIHWGWQAYIYVGKLTIIVQIMACRLDDAQSWNIVNWTLGNKLQWNLNLNSNIFIQENAFENFVWNGIHFASAPIQCVETTGVRKTLQLRTKCRCYCPTVYGTHLMLKPEFSRFLGWWCPGPPSQYPKRRLSVKSR